MDHLDIILSTLSTLAAPLRGSGFENFTPEQPKTVTAQKAYTTETAQVSRSSSLPDTWSTATTGDGEYGSPFLPPGWCLPDFTEPWPHLFF